MIILVPRNKNNHSHKYLNRFLGQTCLLALFSVLFIEPAFAGSGGDAFSDVWDTLKEWTQGTLGRIVAGAMVLVGIVGGIARQSLMAFALGIGGGMGLYNTPTVVESVMSATLPLASESIGLTIPAIAILITP
nr:TraA family conjugative transfer protein [Thorsellia anophelis]